MGFGSCAPEAVGDLKRLRVPSILVGRVQAPHRVDRYALAAARRSSRIAFGGSTHPRRVTVGLAEQQSALKQRDGLCCQRLGIGALFQLAPGRHRFESGSQ